MNYYNEFNPQSAAMLRQMIKDNLIPQGIVDERSITEVTPDDLKGHTQCHFFAGIGGWSYALQLAGWPPTKPVWTGSCPCQPFSSAGRQEGKDDPRHLWPVWERLIRECRPATIFGEQVATAVAHGWLDDVYQGLESEGYAIGAAVLPACSVGAPHKRDRLWFVAYASCQRSGKACWPSSQEVGRPSANDSVQPRGTGASCNVADANSEGLQGYGGFEQIDGTQRWEAEERHSWESGVWVDCPDGKQRLVEPSIPLLADGVQHRKPILHALGNAIVPQVAAEFIKASIKI
jgi:DNA (cytosine-5)-methyltransferase 1